MPTIKTGEWLKATLAYKGMSQRQLADEAGLSLPTIAKIISGERYGAPETWEKITSALGADFNLSVDSEEFIKELQEEVELYGGSAACNVFYEVSHGNIIFKDYLLPEDMPENYKDDLKEMSMLRVTLAEALNLFEAQDKIL